MPATFFSLAAAVPPKVAHAFIEWATPLEHLGALVGPDEETVFAFDEPDVVIDLPDVAAAYKYGLPSVAAFENAFLDADPEEVLAGMRNAFQCGSCVSHGAAAFVVLDRVLAIPRGVPLMMGHATARIQAKTASRIRREWLDLVRDVGDIAGVTRIVKPYLDEISTIETIERAHSAIENAFAAAHRERCDVVLATYRT